jgi:flavin-binding protein dodecin
MTVLKVLEILADSDKGWEDATKKAIKKASETVRDIRSANVQNQSVVVKDGQISAYRVNLKISFEVQ